MRKNPKEKKHPRIRRRVFAYLAAFVAFVLALLWLMQIVWLDDFYRWDKTRQITQAADAVESNIGNEQLSALMDRLAQQNDVCILLLDSDKHVFLSSDDIHYCLIHRMSSRDLSFWCSMIPENGDTLTELFNIAPFGGDQYNSHQFRGNVPKMEDDKKQSLLCARRVTLPDGTGGYLLLNSIITPLDSTVATLRTQLMLITIIVLLGATLLAMLISRKVTRSIVETSEAAHSLSRGQYEIPPHGCEYREMAELNGTLVYAAKELSQVENLQHELIANISHDLRTPLTMIGGYVEMMRDIPGEATPENMQVIIDETQRLTSLVNELLDFSRLQTGALALNPAPYPFTASVQAITDRVSRMVQQNGYQVVFHPAAQVKAIADEQRIAQVVYNLVGNALTYTGENKTVEIHQEVIGKMVRLTIHDSGKGIAPEELPLIWNRYYRTQETHKRAIIGSGLGLSIVRSILEKHNVPFGVDSKEGEGTSFWFELPLTEELRINTRAKYESETNSIARRGQGGDSPLQGQGTASLAGLGAAPQQFHGRLIQREKSTKAQAAKRPCAVTSRVLRRAPKLLFPPPCTLSRQMGATT